MWGFGMNQNVDLHDSIWIRILTQVSGGWAAVNVNWKRKWTRMMEKELLKIPIFSRPWVKTFPFLHDNQVCCPWCWTLGAWLNRTGGGATRCHPQLSWRQSRGSWTCSSAQWGVFGLTWWNVYPRRFRSHSAVGRANDVQDEHQVSPRRQHAPQEDQTPRDKSQWQQRVNFPRGDMRLCNRGAMMLLTTAGAFCAFSLMTIAVGTDYWLYSRGMCRSKSQNDNETVRKNEEVLTHSGLWRTCCTEGKTDPFMGPVAWELVRKAQRSTKAGLIVFGDCGPSKVLTEETFVI